VLLKCFPCLVEVSPCDIQVRQGQTWEGMVVVDLWRVWSLQRRRWQSTKCHLVSGERSVLVGEKNWGVRIVAPLEWLGVLLKQSALGVKMSLYCDLALRRIYLWGLCWQFCSIYSYLWINRARPFQPRIRWIIRWLTGRCILRCWPEIYTRGTRCVLHRRTK
jgi:hypothetical protein